MSRKRVAVPTVHSRPSTVGPSRPMPPLQPAPKRQCTTGLTAITSSLSPVTSTSSMTSSTNAITTSAINTFRLSITSSNNNRGSNNINNRATATSQTSSTTTTTTTRHLACDACRRRKVKCDSVKPSCSCCIRHNIVCHYQTEIRKRGSRANYVSQLEKRLKWMEQLLQSQFISSASPHTAALPVDEHFSLSSGHAGGQSASTENAYRLRLPSIDKPSQTIDAPPALRDHLIQLYFRFMSSHFNLLDRQAFTQQIIATSSPSHSDTALLYSVLAVAARFAQLPNVSAKERHMAGRAYANQSILALKADQSTPSSQSQLTLKTLQILVNLCIHASGGGMDHLYKPAAQHAILLHTECTRLAMMLNLHLIDEQPPMNLGARPDDKTITNLLAEKRRAWWCCFMLNQLSAMVNGQPVSIDEFTFQVDYPFETPNLLGNVDMSTGQVYIPQLLVLLGRVIQFANRPRRSPTSSDQSAITEREQQVAAQLEQELHGWYTQQLPVSLQNFPDIALAVDPTERDCQLAAISTHIALLCLYHTGIILLHRSLLIPHPTRDYCYRMKTPLEHQSIKTYRLSALSLLQLTGRITGDALLYQHPILAYSLWTAAIIWVHDHHILPASSTAALWEASTHLQMVCTLLNQLSVVWEYAGHLEEILKLMLLSPSTHGNYKRHTAIVDHYQSTLSSHQTTQSSMKQEYQLNGRLPVKSYLEYSNPNTTTTTTDAEQTTISQPASSISPITESYDDSSFTTFSSMMYPNNVPSTLPTKSSLSSNTLLSHDDCSLLSTLQLASPTTTSTASTIATTAATATVTFMPTHSMPSSSPSMPTLTASPTFNPNTDSIFAHHNTHKSSDMCKNTSSTTKSKDKSQASDNSTDTTNPMIDFTLLAGQSFFSLDADTQTLASTLGSLLGHEHVMKNTLTSSNCDDSKYDHHKLHATLTTSPTTTTTTTATTNTTNTNTDSNGNTDVESSTTTHSSLFSLTSLDSSIPNSWSHLLNVQ